jgi:hypothetical protein
MDAIDRNDRDGDFSAAGYALVGKNGRVRRHVRGCATAEYSARYFDRSVLAFISCDGGVAGGVGCALVEEEGKAAGGVVSEVRV